MAQSVNLSSLIGKVASIAIGGSASNYKILALDTSCQFIKLVYAENEESAPTWYPLRTIDNIEETE